MPSVSLDTNFYTVSLEKFEESVNRRRIDNTIKEQTMVYKTLHRKLKIEQHELFKTEGLRCSRKVSNSYCIAACEILRLYLLTMYIYCAYPAKSKSPKQLLTCLKISGTFVILIGCHGVTYHDRTYTGTVSFPCSCYPALDLFKQAYCTDWIILVAYDHSPK
jgi:hypothetical protein